MPEQASPSGDARERDLVRQSCEACRAGAPTVSQQERTAFSAQVPDWEMVTEEGIDRLRRVFKFPDFAQALDFTNAVGQLAEEENHHPALLTEWGRVAVTWWTHKIKGLHQNDFICAAKVDRLFRRE